jgi:hypothetical protein
MPRSDAGEEDGGDSSRHQSRTSAAERAQDFARNRQRRRAIQEARTLLNYTMAQTTFEGRQLQISLVTQAGSIAASAFDEAYPARPGASTVYESSDDDFPDVDHGAEIAMATEGGSTQRSGQNGVAGKKGQ